MKKLQAVTLATLNGYYEGPNREFGEWAEEFEGDDFKDASMELFSHVDTILLGRLTYEIGAGYWPTEVAIEKEEHQTVIDTMNDLPKVVFSTTLTEPTWSNTTVVSEDPVGKVRELKEAEGKKLLLIGSNSVRIKLAAAGLIDEFQVQYMPLVFGTGKPLFEGFDGRIDFELQRTTAFASGNVVIDYTVKNQGD